MRFCSRVSGFQAIFAMSVGLSSNQFKQVAQHPANLSADLSAKQKDGQQRLECSVGVGMVDAFVVGQIGVGMGGQRDEGLKVVADDFSSNILNYRLLTQTGDVFQIEAVLESLKRFFNPPALMVELAKAVRRKALVVE